MGSDISTTSIQGQQLDLLVRSTSKVTYVFPITASVLVAVFYSQVPTMQLFGWWLAVILCSALRFSVLRRYRLKNQAGKDYQQWLKALLVVDVCNGLTAGMCALFVMYLPIEYELLVLVILIAISMESVGVQSAIKVSFICFVLPLFCVMIFWLLLVGGQLNYVIAILAVVHLFLLWSNFKSLNSTIQSNFELALKNQGLNVELERSNQELSLSRDQALQTNLAQSKFIADMSHELRTPMQGLLGSIELAKQQSASPRITKTLQIAQAAGATLLNLLNGILELSRTEAKMQSQSTEPCNLSSLCQELIDLVAITAEAKGLSVSMHTEGALPRHVQVDKNRLSQIVLNFLSNAIKFTKKGKIELSLRRVTAHSDRFIITVSDTGVGIDEADIPHIFERFTQLSEGREKGGSGLGLAISAELSRVIGAKITVKSKVGEGSEFSVEFSAHVQESTSPDRPNASEPLNADVSHLRVLVAEDEPLSRLVLEAYFNNLGVKPHIVVNGEEAVSACMEQAFDLIFMDCQMPTLNGIEASQKIRETCALNVTSFIVAMSAHIEAQDAEMVTTAGINLLLGKPIEQKQLTQILLKINATK
ncbi:ATP-binding protein [Alteromonas sp. ASW11-36]|uniref:histidine kinase n=1 Tax=Alteromonas arenosi TaxID=3055817 RepID=A0ABT7SXN5_9ALTE|nr:ATP-binding protein [Alteromonas sp. ASW11-36]MDM7860953.1 ATP-binding protein [Alteromonas sp. ASW11-36]